MSINLGLFYITRLFMIKNKLICTLTVRVLNNTFWNIYCTTAYTYFSKVEKIQDIFVIKQDKNSGYSEGY